MTGRDLPPEWAGLCRTLRGLRAGTGLSLAALAAKTSYSKSSWERYLNGRTLPPRQAVEQLCALVGVDSRRPLAQWDLAETVSSGRAGEAWQGPAAEKRPTAREPAEKPTAGKPTVGRPAVGTAAEAAAGPRPRLLRRHRLALGAVALAVLVVAAALAVLDLRETPRSSPPAVDARAAATGPGCHRVTCTGRNAEELGCSSFADPPATLGEERLDGTMVKVRYSAVCETVWARIDRGTRGDLVEILVPGVPVQGATVKDRFDEAAALSTPMAAAAEGARRVRACLVREGERRCFSAPVTG